MTVSRRQVERLVRQLLDQALAGERIEPVIPSCRYLLAANWKMNMDVPSARRWCEHLAGFEPERCRLVVCPSHVLLWPVARAIENLGLRVSPGAQDLHHEPQGAYTGFVSAGMIREAGAEYVIVGHSERRAAGESDEQVALKLRAAIGAGLVPILCVGEDLERFEKGTGMKTVRLQLDAALSQASKAGFDPARLVVAYEPVWAIGTGKAASEGYAAEMAGFIRQRLAELFSWQAARQVRILYGGSADENNLERFARSPEIDGALVGTASLDADRFRRMTAVLERVKGMQAEVAG